MSEDAYYAALASGAAPVPRRLFRQPPAEQEAMIHRLAKGIVAGTATHRVISNSHTGERTWILRDVSPAEWWMIDSGIDAAARSLIDAAMDTIVGRGDITTEAILRVLTEWSLNDRWTVLCGRDPAARTGNRKTTPRQLEKSIAYATRKNH